jgi:hypothetical protein
VYVSQDRLALAYAHTQGCPCIQTHQDGRVSLFRGEQPVGGMRTRRNTGRMAQPLKYPMKFVHSNKKNISFADVPLFFADVIDEHEYKTMEESTHNPSDYNFNGFLKAYRDVSGKKSMSFFYYVLFKTLYEFVA